MNETKQTELFDYKFIDQLGRRLFETWQRTGLAELDGEHTLQWDEMSKEYRDAWRFVAATAIPEIQRAYNASDDQLSTSGGVSGGRLYKQCPRTTNPEKQP